MKKNYSISYNRQRNNGKGAFCISFRNLQGQWKIKWAPNTYKEHQSLEVEQWFILQYQSLLQTGAFQNQVDVIKTLEMLAPQWLQYRYQKKSLSQNYYKSLESTVHSWILDNHKHPHLSIQKLDMEADFSVSLIRSWISSMTDLSVGSVFNVTGVLRNLFSDMIAQEVLDPEMMNPMEKKPILEMLKELQIAKDRDREVEMLPLDVIHKLIHKTTDPMRRLKYFVAVASGLRDNELHGLTFNDVYLETTTPYLDVNKQLLKGGIFPALQFETLINQGHERAAIMSLPNALVKDPKFNSKRKVPLHPALLPLLRDWQQKGFRAYSGVIPSQASPLFPRAKKGPQAGCFSQSSSAEMLRHDLALMQVESEATFHHLRHTFASLLETVGLDESLIGVLLGHKATTVTRSNYLTKQLPIFAAAIAQLPFLPNVREEPKSQVVS